MFSKETYIQRREVLKKKFNKGIILFLGNDECGMNYTDNTYHFRQDSTFLYYFGISAPDFMLLWIWIQATILFLATTTPSTILFGWAICHQSHQWLKNAGYIKQHPLTN